MRDGEHLSAAPCVRFWAAPERHNVQIDPRQPAYSPRLSLPCTIAPPDASAGNLRRIHGDAGLTHRWVDPGPELRSTSLTPPCVGSSSCGDPRERQRVAKGIELAARLSQVPRRLPGVVSAPCRQQSSKLERDQRDLWASLRTTVPAPDPLQWHCRLPVARRAQRAPARPQTDRTTPPATLRGDRACEVCRAVCARPSPQKPSSPQCGVRYRLHDVWA